MGAFWVGFFLCWFFFRFVFCLLSFFFYLSFFFFPFFLFFLFLVLFFHTKIDHSLSSESENRPPSVQNYKSQRRAVGRGPSSAMAGRGGNGGTQSPIRPSVRPHTATAMGAQRGGGSGGVGSSQLTQNSRRWRRGPSSIPASHLLAGRRTVCNPAEQGQGAITLHGKP